MLTLLCFFVQDTCIGSTLIGTILISLLGEDAQILLVAIAFFSVSIVELSCKIFTISLKKARIISAVFYGVIFALYMMFINNDVYGVQSVLERLFYAFLGWCLKPL